MKNPNSLATKVETILSENFISRISDQELVSEYLQKYICKNWIEKLFIRIIFNREKIGFSSIIRRRAELQNKFNKFKEKGIN